MSTLPYWKACGWLLSTAGTLCVILQTEKISMYSTKPRPPPPPTTHLVQKTNEKEKKKNKEGEKKKRRQEEEKSWG